MNDHRFARCATVALALAAIGAPTASARPDPPVVPGAAAARTAPAAARTLDASIREWRAATARMLAERPARDDVRPDAVPSAPGPDADGVDWGEAGVIGGGTVGAALLGLGAVVLARRRAALRGV